MGEEGKSLARFFTVKYFPTTLIVPILFLAVLVRLPYVIRHYVQYDGYWFIFIAQQDGWRNFWVEFEDNAHPILFYLLLRAVLFIGHSLFIYRLISLLSVIGSAYLISSIAQKLTTRWFVGPLAALAFAISYAPIDISLEVRGNALSVFFVLLALYFYIDLIDPEPVASLNRARIGFSISCILAISSHYFAFFFIAACAVVPIFLILLNSEFRQRFVQIWKKYWRGHLLCILPIIATSFLWHTIHNFDWTILNYLYPHLYGQTNGESVAQFLWRNFQTEFIFLTPWSLNITPGYKSFIMFISLLGLLVVYILWVRSPKQNIRPGIPLAFFLSILSGIAFASVFSRYPFGGQMRQQFILFPFLVLSAAVFLDEITSSIRFPWVRTGLISLVSGLFILNSIHEIQRFPIIEEKLFASEYATFHDLIPNPEAIYVDQFNLIILFSQYDGWEWKFSSRHKNENWIDQYKLRKDGRTLPVCRDRLRWNLNFREAALYSSIRECLSGSNLSSVSVFCASEMPASETEEKKTLLKNEIIQLAKKADLNVRKLVIQESGIYAEFAAEP